MRRDRRRYWRPILAPPRVNLLGMAALEGARRARRAVPLQGEIRERDMPGCIRERQLHQRVRFLRRRAGQAGHGVPCPYRERFESGARPTASAGGKFTNEYAFFGGGRVRTGTACRPLPGTSLLNGPNSADRGRDVSTGTVDYYEADMLGGSRTMMEAEPSADPNDRLVLKERNAGRLLRHGDQKRNGTRAEVRRA